MANKTFWRTNEQIRAREVRAIDEAGGQIGIMPVREVILLAKKEGKDVVEIASKAEPPVVKVIEYGKFKYQEEKKQREQNKKAKSADLKEVRFSPFMGEQDYQTRMKRVREFLIDGDKVRAVVVFKGRQMDSKKFGYDLLKKILREFEEAVSVDMEPKFAGRHLAMIISPIKKKMAAYIQSKALEDKLSKNVKENKAKN